MRRVVGGLSSSISSSSINSLAGSRRRFSLVSSAGSASAKSQKGPSEAKDCKKSQTEHSPPAPLSASPSSSSLGGHLSVPSFFPGRVSVTQRIASAPADVRRPFFGGGGGNVCRSVTGSKPASSWGRQPVVASATGGNGAATGAVGTTHERQASIDRHSPPDAENAAAPADSTCGPPRGISKDNSEGPAKIENTSSGGSLTSAAKDHHYHHHHHDHRNIVHSAKLSAGVGASAFAGALHRATGHTILPSEQLQSHTEHCVMGYSSEQIYSVVADVAAYQEFLPWCKKSTVHREDLPAPQTRSKTATLHVGFAFLKESYTSDVVLVPGRTIFATIRGSSTLLKELQCNWSFYSLAAGDGDVSSSASSAETRHLLEQFFSDGWNSHQTVVGAAPSKKPHLAAAEGHTKSLLQRLAVPGSRKASSSSSTIRHHNHRHHHSGDLLLFPEAALVDFSVSFAFRNPIHNSLSSLVMSNVVSVMTSSFEARCRDLHGPPTGKRMSLTELQAMPHLLRLANAGSSSQATTTLDDTVVSRATLEDKNPA
jgi:coenzyme Q-binding protein COQ10